jgi:glycosyltransferase involved in cell wall biosynthesis
VTSADVVFVELPDSDSFEKSGLGIHCKGLRESMDRSGVSYTKIGATLPNRFSGFFRWLHSGILRPILQLHKIASEDTVIHITYELHGYLIPFLKGKKVITFHHVLTEKDGVGKSWYRQWRFFAKIAARCADSILAVSSQTRDELVKLFHVPESKVHVIMNKPSDAFVTMDDVKRERFIGFVGSLTERKNVASLIRSFRTLIEMPGMSDVSLKICGGGPRAGDLRDLANSLGIADRTEFMENISANDLVTFYNTMSVLANPSMHEGFGYVTLEAQRCSTPVVFFKDADIPHEVMKYAIPCTDENEFACTMHRLLTDHEYWSAVSGEGKRYADSFGNDYSEKILDLYYGPKK